MNKIFKPVIATIFVLFSVAANASVIPDLFVDFRSTDWSGAWNKNLYTYNGVTISALPTTKTIFQNKIDGIGILGGEPDEINPGEMMNISFNYSASTASALTGVWITDLFDAPDGGINGEEGYVSLTLANGTVIDYSFFGNASHQANGEQYIDFGAKLQVVSAFFQTNGVAGNEFSIAGFTAIPEASTISMLVIGLILMGFTFRRKNI